MPENVFFPCVLRGLTIITIYIYTINHMERGRLVNNDNFHNHQDHYRSMQSQNSEFAHNSGNSSDFMLQKMIKNLMLAMSPTCHSSNTSVIC